MESKQHLQIAVRIHHTLLLVHSLQSAHLNKLDADWILNAGGMIVTLNFSDTPTASTIIKTLNRQSLSLNTMLAITTLDITSFSNDNRCQHPVTNKLTDRHQEAAFAFGHRVSCLSVT